MWWVGSSASLTQSGFPGQRAIALNRSTSVTSVGVLAVIEVTRASGLKVQMMP